MNLELSATAMALRSAAVAFAFFLPASIGLALVFQMVAS